MRPIVLCAALLAVAGLVAWFVTSRGEEPARGRGEAGRPRGSVERQETSAPSGPARQRQAPEEEHPWLEIVNATDGAPIVGASYWRCAPEEPVLPWASGLGDSDASGKLWFEDGLPEGSLGIAAAGFVPVVVDRPEAGATVPLRPAGKLTVVALDERGLPVAGAIVILTSQGVAALGRDSPGFGNPNSARPRWVEVTDDAGRAAFGCLPAASLRLDVGHEAMVPAGPRLEIEIEPGAEETASVALLDAYGVAFAIPDRLETQSIAWRVPLPELSRLPNVITRLDPVRTALERRLPGCLTQVGRPNDITEPAMVGCTAVTTDGSTWTGEWPLTPVRELVEPVFLELDEDGGVREIAFDVIRPDGKPILGLPLFVMRDRTYLQVLSGEAQFLPHGVYRVLAPGSGYEIDVEEVRIDAAQPPGPRYTIHAPENLVLVELWPTPSQKGEFVGRLRLNIQDANGLGPMISNWRPERGPIRVCVAEGEFRVKVSGYAFRSEQQVHTAALVDGVDVQKIEIPLSPKQ